MAKYFLGSVGKAEAFRRNDAGELELAFVSKTLTDSGLNISTTKEDIRGGQGAPIQFSFYHDPSVEITLTDVVWKPEYLEAQLGAKFTEGNEEYITAMLTFANGECALGDNPEPKKMMFCNTDSYLIWGAKKGTDDWQMVKYDGKKFSIENAEGEYCVRYLGTSDRAQIAEINSVIIPEELVLIITAPLFAGDACAASKGQTAGTITFEVPRFQLNGAQEFSMNMSSNQTMSLAGIALASEAADCDAVGGRLLRVIQVINNRDVKSEIFELVSDEEYEKAGEVPHIYGLIKNSTPRLMKLSDLEITKTNGDSFNGTFVAEGEYTVKLAGTDKPGPTVSIKIPSAAA